MYLELDFESLLNYEYCNFHGDFILDNIIINELMHLLKYFTELSKYCISSFL